MSTISWPTLSRAPMRLDWRLRANTQVFVSPLSGEVQTLALPGSRWVVLFSALDLDGSADVNDQGLLAAFLFRLRGQANRAALYNFARPTPIGTVGTSGVTVDGATSAGATSVSFAGCGASKTLVDGDFFAVAGELKMVVAGPYTADGSGDMANVSFEPPARAAWSNAAGVTLDKPTALFILQDPETGFSAAPGGSSDFDLAFVEVFS